MREVAHIPHPIMRVTVHNYNGQFRLQFVLDRFEQAFKFAESDHTLAEVEFAAAQMATNGPTLIHQFRHDLAEALTKDAN